MEAGGLDEATADRLTDRTSKIISSVRVRKDAVELLDEKIAEPAAKAKDVAPQPQPRKAKGKEKVDSPTEAPQPVHEPATADPFAFGLVPVYKREGAEGLSARLARIGSAEHLRAMAKAQQIILARELRTGDVDVATLRTAIVEAVERRVADRRAI